MTPPITFNPGPAQVYDFLHEALQDAYRQGILSLPHRSKDFEAIVVRCRQLMQQKLDLPSGYRLLFLSSATEAWEVIAQSLIRAHSTHLFSGAFGERCFTYTRHLHPQATGLSFGIDQDPGTLLDAIPAESELIALTHNETSNTTALPTSFLEKVRRTFPEALISVDATSSMGGVLLPWQQADIWYASVQKCFGLPAGLGVMCLSPQAVERVRQIGERGRYNSLSYLLEKMENNQTTYTPNVLNIYLLMRVLEYIPHIVEIDLRLRQRAKEWYRFLEEHPQWQPLVQRADNRSVSVLGVQGSPQQIQAFKQHALAQGIHIGNGYGPWKAGSFRIANFPAIPDAHFQQLSEVFSTFQTA
ncbi:aminotransferase class V-fold PLP-dependent enzyme [Thermonema rossianum]|jgi:phosphoserine aminotransferase|uniref:aminotransferase class V-fold PLP-dependent enzyme n=1 Tax=Thermonema rossianum TaxID=55505 RepID=UPI00056DED1C|nr:aminotransferase class V-fold PLP-dependent enzyme [Thermonema rossianum]